MTTAMYRTKPVEIEISDPIADDNIAAIVAWIEAGNGTATALPPGYTVALAVATQSGQHDAHWGDRIALGTRGEFYPLRPDVFGDKYEPAQPA